MKGTPEVKKKKNQSQRAADACAMTGWPGLSRESCTYPHKPPAIPGIDTSLDILESQIRELGNLAGVAAERLSAILCVPPPAYPEETSPQLDDSGDSPMRQRIDFLTADTTTISDKLRTLLDRLDL